MAALKSGKMLMEAGACAKSIERIVEMMARGPAPKAVF